MKKESASRRKKLPLLLGALLIISVAAYGTRAYFSDSATQQGNIQLSLGDVDISTDNTSTWNYTPLEIGDNIDSTKAKNEKLNIVEKDGAMFYSNVRPGDSFTRTYSIKNNGSLDVNVQLSSANIPIPIATNGDPIKYEDGPFKISVSGLKNNFTLNPDQELTYTVVITVDTTVGNSANMNQINQDKITKDYLKKAITIKAVQTNAKDITKVN